MIKNNHSGKYNAPCIPYMGSKAQIISNLMAVFPDCDHFLDACCGGGSVGYSMITYDKAKKVTLNDIYNPVIDLHKAIINNEVDFESIGFCSREQFFYSLSKIDSGNYSPIDVIYMYCYSFGNDAKNYLWGKDIEKQKESMYTVICGKTVKERRISFRKFLQSLQSLESLRSLESLESLQRLERLENKQILFMNKDIFDIDYSKYDCVYFDIPYENTSAYKVDFDHAKFWKFFMLLKIKSFASSYKAPDFVPLAKEINKRSLRQNIKNNGNQIGLEKIYSNNRI